MASRIQLLVGGKSGGYVRFSLPVPSGEWRDSIPLQLVDHDGREFPWQGWPLARWPDGSIRMWHVVTRLEPGNYFVDLNASLKSTSPAPPVSLRCETLADSNFKVENGTGVTFFPKDQLCGGVTEAESVYFDGSSLSVQVVSADGCSFSALLEAEHPIKRIQEGPLYLKLERWLRCASSVEGHFLRFRAQFEFFAGIPGFVLNLLLVNDGPGSEYQILREINLKIQLANPLTPSHIVYQNAAGFEGASGRFAETNRPLDIHVDSSSFAPYISNFKNLEDPTIYPPYLKSCPTEVQNTVFLKDASRVLQIEMEDFHLTRPKGLVLQDGGATLNLWPEWAELLKLPQGKRRQIRLAVSPATGGMPKTLAAAKQISENLLNQWNAQMPPAVYREAEFFDQARLLECRPDLYPRMEGWLGAASQLRTAANFFDLGDTIDTHYQKGYIPVRFSERIRNKEESPPLIFTTSGRMGQCHDSLGDYEPIWTNNEYDVLYCLGTEFLRTANLLLFHQLRWFARHTVEVDFVCFSDYPIIHRAQPAHSERHTSSSAYPSHFWAQGLTQYYFLTGDEDALEVVEALADKTIWYFEHPILGALHHGINREIGWSVLTLVSAYEATLDKKYSSYALRLIESAMAEPLPTDLPVLSFGHTSLLLGCRAYLQAHPDSDVLSVIRKYYLEIVDLAIKSSQSSASLRLSDREKPKLSYDFEFLEKGAAGLQARTGVLAGYAALDCLAYAYEITNDKSYLRAGLRTFTAFLDGTPGHFDYTISFRNPIPEGKSFAVVHRMFITYLGALSREKLLAAFDYPIER